MRTHVYTVHVLATERIESETDKSHSTETPVLQNDYRCIDCTDSIRIFANADALYQHQVAKHFSNNICDDVLLNNSIEQQSEEIRHHNDCTLSDNNVFTCTICGAIGVCGDDHLQLLKPVKEGSNLSCTRCNKMFRFHRDLTQHIKFCSIVLKS